MSDGRRVERPGTRSIAIGFLALAIVYLAAVTFRSRSGAAELLVQLTYLLPFVLCVVATVIAAAVTRGLERRFWSMLSLANAFILIGETTASVRIVMAGLPAGSWPAVQSLLYGIAAATYVALIISLTRFPVEPAVASARRLIDGTSLFLVIFVFALRFLLGSAAVGLGLDPQTRVLGTGYLVVGAALLGTTIYNLAGGPLYRWPAWERFVLFGIGFYSLGVTLWPLWLQGQLGAADVSVSHVVELVWMVGQYLVFMAAYERLDPRWRHGRLTVMPRIAPRRRTAVLVTLAVIGMIGTAASAYFAHTASAGSVDRAAFTVAAFALCGLLIARVVVLTVENGALFGGSVRDALTGLFGHRYYHEQLNAEIELSRRHGTRTWVATFDLDDFGLVNAAFGHRAGDVLLIEAARTARGAIPSRHELFRLGADRFAIIFTEEEEPAVLVMCETVMDAMRMVRTPLGVPVTLSVGIASYPEHAVEPSPLTAAAESARTWAKTHGKNQVVVYDAKVIRTLDDETSAQEMVRSTRIALLESIAISVDAREYGAESHSRHVAELTELLGRAVGLDEGRLISLRIAARLHDVGKIGVPEGVLTKRQALTPEDRRHIREHAGLGERIASSAGLGEILPWIRHHHERWDGTGYPDGLRGEETPLEARIIAVCDAYDAMTSERVYHRALSVGAALQELDLCIGTQFDPELAEEFIRIVSGSPVLRGGSARP